MIEVNDKNFNDETKSDLVLAYFGASWCGPCKMVEPLINELSDEIEGAKVVKVNVDDSPNTITQFSVRAVPTFILFKDGEVVQEFKGANPSKDFYKDMIENAK